MFSCSHKWRKQYPVRGTAIPFNGIFINAQDCWRYENSKASSYKKRVMVDTGDQLALTISELKVDTCGQLTFSDSRDLTGIEIGPKRKPIKNVRLKFSVKGVLEMNLVECFEKADTSHYDVLYNLPPQEVEYVGEDGDFWVRFCFYRKTINVKNM